MLDEFSDLKQELGNYLDESQIGFIQKAFEISKEAHEGQKRHTGEPYIIHPVAVTKILAEMHMDPPTLAAALLHDVIEDTYLEKQDLINEFGAEVANLVDGVTKLTQIHFESRAEAQAENFRKMVMAMAKDIRVIIIKLADRLHNMRTLGICPRHKRHRIAKETLEIYSPIANRLGMHAVRVEFEDLGFSVLYPLRYKVLKNAVSTALGNRREMMELIHKDVENTFKKAGLRVRVIKGREKHLYSIYKKMHDKHLSFSEVMDVYGFRIIVDKIDSCYRVLGALHNLYKPITQRFKDYIAIPKANGYQSLHTVLFGPYGVPIEVQIRTDEMHKMAEYGISAHWLYKREKIKIDEAQQRAQEWLKGVLEMHQSSKNSLEFIENVKTDLFPDEVYVFTPKGSILELPQGATPVDFAYAIHSDIGNTCVAAKLDKRLSPLSTTLLNGQQVEIITAPGGRPNPHWLSFVVTGKARSNIRHFLKRQQRDESIALGKRLVEKSLHSFGLTLDDVSDDQLTAAAKALNLESTNHFFEEIGIGNRTSLLAAKQIAKVASIPEIELKEQPLKPSSFRPLAIRGTEGIAITLAKCCRPIPGDPIGGYIESGQGLLIHVENCPILDKYHHNPERYVTLHWEKKIRDDFPVDIGIDIHNQRGSLASLALIVADADSNIINIMAEEFGSRDFTVNMTVTVRDRNHLAKVLRKIRNNKHVVHVKRIKPDSKGKKRKAAGIG